MASIFKFHDRNKFIIVGFSLWGDDGSKWRKKIERRCDEFYSIPVDASAYDVAKFVNDKNIHILFNLNGWTFGGRQDVFSLRPSPISINYMGFCGSIGADYIDYILTDEIASPPESF
jgi:protein O-GlcNAc transferase